jgi:ligand-binding SRPBCC domain-containing protein
MKYQHKFRVKAPLDKVRDLYEHTSNMAALTPPPLSVQVHRGPATHAEGSELDFTLWMGLLPVRWVARFEEISAGGFIDRQVRGPFRTWIHRHRYSEVSSGVTEVKDEIEISLRNHPLWTFVGLGMWLGLPVLFAFRSWKTRKILESV